MVQCQEGGTNTSLFCFVFWVTVRAFFGQAFGLGWCRLPMVQLVILSLGRRIDSLVVIGRKNNYIVGVHYDICFIQEKRKDK